MNRTKKVFWVTLIFSIIATSLLAQDIHFSQYYLSPLTQNPANAGSFVNANRFSALYRNQWYKASSTPFQSSDKQSPEMSLVGGSDSNLK